MLKCWLHPVVEHCYTFVVPGKGALANSGSLPSVSVCVCSRRNNSGKWRLIFSGSRGKRIGLRMSERPIAS